MPTKSNDGTLKDKGTIRGQQIIDHIIENLLVKPGSCDSNDSAKNGLNNNADNLDNGLDNSDRIKASIYESLKNDLLKEKNHSVPKPGDLPYKNLQAHRGRVKKAGSEEAARVPTVEPSSSRDIMRLVTQNLASPVSLGQTSVTITRAPRSQGPVPPSCFPEQRHTTSLTLTPAPSSGAPHHSSGAPHHSSGAPHHSSGAPQQHSPTLLVAGQPRGIVLAHQPVSLSHHPSLQKLVSQPVSFSHAAPHGAVLLQSPATTVLLSHPTTSSGVLLSSSAPQLVLATSSRPTSDCGAVNLTMSRAGEGEEDEDGRKSARSCKGKRYQEFIEDGRIAVGSRKRRSHRSGEDESEEETALNLSQHPAPTLDSGNHWKKKQLRTANPLHEPGLSNGGGEWRGRKPSGRQGDQANKAFSARYQCYLCFLTLRGSRG